MPKPSKDIRLCVDMKMTNKAVIRETHYMPTMKEVLLDLQGSTVFNKCDLKWRFHQIDFNKSPGK